MKYVVRDFESLVGKVVPFCEGRLVVKREPFESLKDVLRRVSDREHLTQSGLLQIVDIAYAMNTKARRVPRATLAAAILGGSLAAGSHFAKAGSRAVINTSPEPFSNWAASFGDQPLRTWSAMNSHALSAGGSLKRAAR